MAVGAAEDAADTAAEEAAVDDEVDDEAAEPETSAIGVATGHNSRSFKMEVIDSSNVDEVDDLEQLVAIEERRTAAELEQRELKRQTTKEDELEPWLLKDREQVAAELGRRELDRQMIREADLENQAVHEARELQYWKRVATINMEQKKKKLRMQARKGPSGEHITKITEETAKVTRLTFADKHAKNSVHMVGDETVITTTAKCLMGGGGSKGHNTEYPPQCSLERVTANKIIVQRRQRLRDVTGDDSGRCKGVREWTYMSLQRCQKTDLSE